MKEAKSENNLHHKISSTVPYMTETGTRFSHIKAHSFTNLQDLLLKPIRPPVFCKSDRNVIVTTKVD
tara:strand:+ start:486 stop:686 length:201 start_codon:yes stop_codon:yes gene_type:complete